MDKNQLCGLNQLKGDLWEEADQLRANSKLTSTEYCMPQKEDDDFYFRETSKEIRNELVALNTQAVKSSKQITADPQSLLENMADDRSTAK